MYERHPKAMAQLGGIMRRMDFLYQEGFLPWRRPTAPTCAGGYGFREQKCRGLHFINKAGNAQFHSGKVLSE